LPKGVIIGGGAGRHAIISMGRDSVDLKEVQLEVLLPASHHSPCKERADRISDLLLASITRQLSTLRGQADLATTSGRVATVGSL